MLMLGGLSNLPAKLIDVYTVILPPKALYISLDKAVLDTSPPPPYTPKGVVRLKKFTNPGILFGLCSGWVDTVAMAGVGGWCINHSGT